MQEQLEITTRIGCSVNCTKYCPQEVLVSKYTGSRVMTLEQFKILTGSVPANVMISFAGFCEPFLNTDTTDMILHAHGNGHKVQLFTTLVGFTERDLERLKDVPFDSVILHLPDAKGYAHIPITKEYKALLPRVLTTFNCDVMTMGGSFCTNQPGGNRSVTKYCRYCAIKSRCDNTTCYRTATLFSAAVITG
jgi:hypothetical protein